MPQILHFTGLCYRAHDPRWSFKPLSGEGAATHGARFNPKGVPALYLALSVMGAVREANHGFAHRLDPCVLCAYEIDCADIVDLRTCQSAEEAGIAWADLTAPWMSFIAEGREPASWRAYTVLFPRPAAGILVKSFAPGAGAGEGDCNLVLWRWGDEKPYRARVLDPQERLPRNQASWR